jgi:3-oxoacyl-ACP reductase-like protein
MSIFGSILSKIFPSAHAAEATSTASAAAPAPVPAGAPAAAAPPSAIPLGDVSAVLDAMPASKNLNWRTSIVDLMKLLGLDSSLEERKKLAAELSYGEDTSDSAKMNIWLHRQVMTKLAANGGTVPAELRD